MDKPLSNQHKNALLLLIDDHNVIRIKLKEFLQLTPDKLEQKKELADTICRELSIHHALEEELLYPAIRQAITPLDAQVDEALVEHQSAKILIAEIQTMQATDSLFEARVKVLSEQIMHHFREEEEGIFPKLKDSSLDLFSLGEQMMARKKHLQS